MLLAFVSLQKPLIIILAVSVCYCFSSDCSCPSEVINTTSQKSTGDLIDMQGQELRQVGLVTCESYCSCHIACYTFWLNYCLQKQLPFV